MYQQRTYRHQIQARDMVAFEVAVEETDLYLRASRNLKNKALRLVLKYREMLEKYIQRCPVFLTSLVPVPADDNAPVIIKMMCRAAAQAGVGPMAAVAGAIAESVGEELAPYSPELIIENGGDIYLKSSVRRVVGIYAGESPLSGKIGMELHGDGRPLGICTSSGTVGHSFSAGNADAVIIVAGSTALADAAATAVGNRVRTNLDIEPALVFARGIAGVKSAIIVIGDKLGFWGDARLCRID